MNVCGEGGEYESLVLDCPLFTKRIEMYPCSKLVNKPASLRWKRTNWRQSPIYGFASWHLLISEMLSVLARAIER